MARLQSIHYRIIRMPQFQFVSRIVGLTDSKKSIDSHKLWISVGSPRLGLIFNKLTAIKPPEVPTDQQSKGTRMNPHNTNELHEALIKLF